MTRIRKSPTMTGPFAETVHEFIQYKRSVGFKYADEPKCLSRFCRFSEEQGVTEIEISRSLAERWIAPREGESEKSRSHRITCIRQFAIYLNNLGYDAYIVPEVKGLNHNSFVPYIFTHEQITSVIKAADETEPREVARNMHLALPVIFRILYGCGLRVSEVVGLRYKDVNLEEGILTIREAKTDRDRYIPLSDRFVRYADDCMIFCKSRKSAERTLENIIPFIERKLFLKVNRKKTKVAHISKVKYLGYTFYGYKGKCRFRVHPKSVTKMKNKIRELTDRNNGMSNAKREEKYQQFVRGWVNYFKLADMRNLLKKTDEWARRRIRAVYWKQWKKIKTKYRMLKSLGLEQWKAKELACSRKGYWRMAQVLNSVITNKIIAKLGYTSMLDYYLTVCEN